MFAEETAPCCAWDFDLFQMVHATTQPSAGQWLSARVLAEVPILLSVGLLIALIAMPRDGMRASAIRAACFAMVALLVNGLIGLLWDRPRPFMAGAGPAWIPHAPTGSFPSNHLTVQWVIAGALLLDRRTRAWGIVVAILGLPMAWARIYLGVHYPGDMLGALTVAGVIVACAWLTKHRKRQPLTLR